MRTSRVKGLVGLVALFATLSACGGGGGGSPPPTGTGIGPAGGTASSPEGASVVVPPGALASEVSIKVARDATGAAPLPVTPDMQQSGDVFALTPHGTAFSKVATLSIPFDPARVPAGARVLLLKTDSSQANWAPVAGTTVSGSLVSGAISSFSNAVAVAGFPPLLVAQPTGQTVTAGQSATFSVAAIQQTGGSPLVYSWESSADQGATWMAVPGATGPTYSTPATTLADDGTQFRVTVGLQALPLATVSAVATLTVVGGGYLYVSDRPAHRIVRMAGNLAGAWATVSANASGTDQLTSPWGVYVDAAGKIFVADGTRVVQTDIGGTTWSTLSGKAGGTDPFVGLEGITLDAAGRVYVTDWGGPAPSIARVVQTDLAGQTWNVLGGTAGSGTQQFRCPGMVFVDGADLYVADRCNNRIVKTGTDMSGTRWEVLSGNHAGTDSFAAPRGVWVGGSQLYVADESNGRLVITGTDMSGNAWTPVALPPAGMFPAAPSAVAAAPSGDIFTVSYRAPYLVQVDPVSRAATTFTAGPNGETFQGTFGVFFRE